MSAETKSRVGIAGYGVVGKRRHTFIDQHPDLHVTAVCDLRFRDRGERINGVTCYPTYRELLEGEKLDMLFVCMPPDIAPEITIAGIERGLNVFCEKPPSRTVRELESVIECEHRHAEVKLKYGFNHRYHGSVQDALARIQSGEFGKVINMRGVYGKSAIVPWPRMPAPALREGPSPHWRTSREVAGGGILLDQGIHMVDLMCLFAGEFVHVQSVVRNGFWEHDVEDNAYALMTTEEGVVALLHSTATEWRHRFGLEINLEGGSLILSGILSGTRSYGDETLTIVKRDERKHGSLEETTRHYLEDHSWREEIFEFAEAISTGTPVLAGTSADALRSMKLVYRIYCADEEWKKKYGLTEEG